MFKFKDFIPVYLRYHLIYKFQYSNCISKSRLRLAKNKPNAKQQSEAEFVKIWKNCSHSFSTLWSKNDMTYSEKQTKRKLVFTHEITWLIIMKLKMKVKDRSHKLDMNRPRSRHGHKYSKYVSVWWCLYVLSNN